MEGREDEERWGERVEGREGREGKGREGEVWWVRRGWVEGGGKEVGWEGEERCEVRKGR